VYVCVCVCACVSVRVRACVCISFADKKVVQVSLGARGLASVIANERIVSLRIRCACTD